MGLLSDVPPCLLSVGRSCCYLQAAPAALIARLRTLTRSRLLEVMGASMTVREVDLLLEKRTQVVAYFDAMEARRSLEHRLL